MEPARKLEHDANDVRPSPGPTLGLAGEHTPAAPSPAMHMQDALLQAFATVEAEEKWSPRRTAAFLLVTCGGFWACVAALVFTLI